MLSAPTPIDYVLPGLPAGSVGLLYGPGGVGKSFLFLSAALAVSAGTPLFGQWPAGQRVGRVVYLAGEDSFEILWHRLYSLGAAWLTGSGGGTRAAADQLRDFGQRAQIHSLVGSIPTLAGPGPGYRSILKRQDWIDEITQAAQGARLLIIDPLARFHQLDENGNADMTALVLQVIPVKVSVVEHVRYKYSWVYCGMRHQSFHGKDFLTL